MHIYTHITHTLNENIFGIQGKYFDSVLQEEYMITVGGEPCNVTSVNETVITCILPLNPPGEYKVMVRNIIL